MSDNYEIECWIKQLSDAIKKRKASQLMLSLRSDFCPSKMFLSPYIGHRKYRKCGIDIMKGARDFTVQIKLVGHICNMQMVLHA